MKLLFILIQKYLQAGHIAAHHVVDVVARHAADKAARAFRAEVQLAHPHAVLRRHRDEHRARAPHISRRAAEDLHLKDALDAPPAF